MKINPTPDTKSIAERLLSETFSTTVRLGEGRDLGGSRRTKVYRFPVLHGSGALPASVIVKQAHSTAEAPYAPERALEPAWTLFNDWASLQFLSQVAGKAALAPRFYAGNRTTGLFVMEDLGEDRRLDHFLLGDDPHAAEAALIEFAALHGRLHALTRNHLHDFTRVREALGPLEWETSYYRYEWFAPTLHQTADILGITPAPGVDAELATLTASLLNPGPFLTFTQGDSCPDNCLYVQGRMRLLDFEGGEPCAQGGRIR